MEVLLARDEHTVPETIVNIIIKAAVRNHCFEVGHDYHISELLVRIVTVTVVRRTTFVLINEDAVTCFERECLFQGGSSSLAIDQA